MYKGLYIIENSVKELKRTKGIVETAILLGILGFIFFSTIEIYFLLNQWHFELLTQVSLEDASIGILQVFSPKIVLIRIMKVIIFILSAGTFCSMVSYLRRTFIQFAIIQRFEFHIMSLIGESTEMIGLWFSLQPVMLVCLILSISGILTTRIFNELLDVKFSYGEMYQIQAVFISVCACYVALRTFAYIKRYLYSIFDNQLSPKK